MLLECLPEVVHGHVIIQGIHLGVESTTLLPSACLDVFPLEGQDNIQDGKWLNSNLIHSFGKYAHESLNNMGCVLEDSIVVTAAKHGTANFRQKKPSHVWRAAETVLCVINLSGVHWVVVHLELLPNNDGLVNALVLDSMLACTDGGDVDTYLREMIDALRKVSCLRLFEVGHTERARKLLSAQIQVVFDPRCMQQTDGWSCGVCAGIQVLMRSVDALLVNESTEHVDALIKRAVPYFKDANLRPDGEKLRAIAAATTAHVATDDAM